MAFVSPRKKNKMVYKPFRDISLSYLGMGNMRLPSANPRDRDAPVLFDEAMKIIRTAYLEGINYFDTAYVYNAGDSEKCLGEAMKPFDRSTYYLATKFNIDVTTDYRAVFEESLRRLNTDYIDFYLIHALSDTNADKYVESGAVQYFIEQKEQGRIRYLGFSTHAAIDTLQRFLGVYDWDFAQIQMNYYDWKYGRAKEEYELLTEKKIPIMVMEPVRGGILADLTQGPTALLRTIHLTWSSAEWALRFVKSFPNVQVVLSGMSTMDQLKENLKTFTDREGLTGSETQILMDACEMFKRQVQVPCTACRYCCSSCPAGINIPSYLKVLNDYKVTGEAAIWHIDQIESDGKPADCVQCGACTQHCPQNIDIPNLIRELAALIS